MSLQPSQWPRRRFRSFSGVLKGCSGAKFCKISLLFLNSLASSAMHAIFGRILMYVQEVKWRSLHKLFIIKITVQAHLALSPWRQTCSFPELLITRAQSLIKLMIITIVISQVQACVIFPKMPLTKKCWKIQLHLCPQNIQQINKRSSLKVGYFVVLLGQQVAAKDTEIGTWSDWSVAVHATPWIEDPLPITSTTEVDVSTGKTRIF